MPVDNISAGVKLFCWVLSWGATYFIHSTCLIAGIWLFVRRRQTAGHALREILWKTALVGGVVTASVQTWLAPVSPFGELTWRLEGIGLPAVTSTVAPAANVKDSSSGFDTTQKPESTRYAGDGDSLPTDELSPGDLIYDARVIPVDPRNEVAEFAIGPAGSHVVSDKMSATRHDRSAFSLLIGKPAWPLPAAYALAIAMALLAIVLGLARCGWQTILLRRKLARCRLIQGGPARTLLDELLRLVPRAPDVRLLSAPEDSEPAAFGVSRWTIVLPPRAAFDLTEDELRALLAHELAHLVRGDSFWLSVSRAVCSCLAFQPLNHLARREWQRTAEFLCDNWAVSRTGAPLALARCLTEVAGWRLAGPASAAILTATGRRSGLVDRIERLLDARPVFEPRHDLRVRRRTIFAGAIVLVTLACCAPRVQLVAAAPRENEQVAEESRSGSLVATVREQKIGDAQEARVANPPADSAQQVSEEELQNEAVKGPGSGAPSAASAAPGASATPRARATAGKNAAQRSAGDTASLLEAIDRDLVALADELEQLGPLLQDNAVPQVVALARRLSDEIVRLQHRREVLKALSRKSVK